MKTRTQTPAWRNRHKEALATSSFLTSVFRQMYRRKAANAPAKKVVKVLKEAGVVGLLLGTHGVGGYRSQPRRPKMSMC